MIPTLAVVDPLLTVSCPQQITAHVGLDALAQVVEPFLSCLANPVVDALAREGIMRASRSLCRAVAQPDDLEAREDMSIASMLGGLCLANAKLGTVHGFAGVIGGGFDSAPHGAICGLLLPKVFRASAERLSSIAHRAADSEHMRSSSLDKIMNKATAQRRLQRFREVSRIITANPDADIGDGVAWLDMPGLTALCGMQERDIPRVSSATAAASSTKGNPVVLNLPELEAILRSAL